MDVHECVSFILLNESQVLLEKRSESKETDPGLITIPGGHIEKGENQVQALFRELDEELNVVPIHYKYLCSLYHPTKELQLIHYFVVSDWKGDIKAQEADDVKWYSLNTALVGIAADGIALREVERVGSYL
ncbi:NUDIX domain-containing protein [Vibrio sp. 10N.261.46.E12]|uniref:NUDIX hydrolase n=1 Tax=unclassified Vibrio TaxID=2614977 RepID=UPI0009782AC1|nr:MULTISPECIES: NUDIX domain-containing protein [unclassified Vibrio]OMO34745.1 NTP pyrophosphohydrolase [Vibrio sp. 10N.261.45.E1]PMJ29307.1 NTP pyrophosphohydrolase [Vibrio sp. 10N.286.45.B6]PML87760.1 NTP pyrophosphohydrolase [Vibrio sp. 10N.261.49.E11]PMM77195.1 NTP pyrophosphohydrolase [Vibrio sp. 10N.261.46.F12]PMM88727.1 NTP pyrophosphohydrolase [Vibrio sp. 10N.261.46.E8]